MTDPTDTMSEAIQITLDGRAWAKVDAALRVVAEGMPSNPTAAAVYELLADSIALQVRAHYARTTDPEHPWNGTQSQAGVGLSVISCDSCDAQLGVSEKGRIEHHSDGSHTWKADRA